MKDLGSSAREEVMSSAPVCSEPYVDTGLLEMNHGGLGIAAEPVIDTPEHYDPTVLAAHLRTVQPQDRLDPLYLTIDALAGNLPPVDKVTRQGAVCIRDAEFLVAYLDEEEAYIPVASETLDIPETVDVKELNARELADGLEAALREVTIVNPQVRRTANMILRGLNHGTPSEQQLKDASYMLSCILSSTPTIAA